MLYPSFERDHRGKITNETFRRLSFAKLLTSKFILGYNDPGFCGGKREIERRKKRVPKMQTENVN